MLKPFYQGKLDAFCAVYAVLNALKLTHGIRTGKARDILNETLADLATRPSEFREFLTQETDYVKVVDTLLAARQKIVPLEVIKPYAPGDKPDEAEVWRTLKDWVGEGGGNRAAVMRFLRYLKADDKPLNRHWTTVDFVRDDVMHLFDCSHEAEAILNIRDGTFVTHPDRLAPGKLLYVQPDSLRLARLPF